MKAEIARLDHPGPREYLLPGVPGFCENVPGTAGAAAGAAAAAVAGAAAGAAAATALIFTTTHVVAKIAAVAAAPAKTPTASAPVDQTNMESKRVIVGC